MRKSSKQAWMLAAIAVTALVAWPAVARWLRRAGAARRDVDLRTTVVVGRPVSEVFQLCRDFENFPRLTDVPLRIQDYQDGRSRWELVRHSGNTVVWDAVVTKYLPSAVIAWASVPDSPVQASGTMRFYPISPDATRVDIALKYTAPSSNVSGSLRSLLDPPLEGRIRARLAQASAALSDA